MYSFNSIKVRLRPVIEQMSIAELKFQFHKGAIKTRMPTRQEAYFLRFNSIKVRLRHGRDDDVYQLYAFQFHKGAIKTLINNNMSTTYNSFNSIKVRLRRQKVCQQLGRGDGFQFHKGAIKTVIDPVLRLNSQVSIP